MENKRILITGGAGFIATNFAEILEKKNEVICLDLLPSKFGKSLVADVTKKDWFGKVGKVDYIFHLASVVGVDYVSTHPEETRSTEIIGMRNLISLAKMLKPERIIYSSTSSVYDAIFSPTSYNTSKLFSEQLLRDSGSDYTILRYFNTYGKYQKDKMVVARFIRCALEKKPLLVFGDGSQTRDFTCIDDVIKATLLLAKSKKAEGKTVDIGTGKQTTILQLASLIRDIFNPSSKLLFVPFIEQRKPFEVNKRKSEISGLYDLTGFKCRTSLKQGLMKMKEKILLSE